MEKRYVSEILQILNEHVLIKDVLKIFSNGSWWRVFALTIVLIIPFVVILAIITRNVLRFL
jgi:hypothetical protein